MNFKFSIGFDIVFIRQNVDRSLLRDKRVFRGFAHCTSVNTNGYFITMLFTKKTAVGLILSQRSEVWSTAIATRKKPTLGKDLRMDVCRESGRHGDGQLVLTNNNQPETKGQDSRHRQVINNSRQSAFDSHNWRLRHSDPPSDSGAITGWRRRNNATIEFKKPRTPR